MGDDDDFFFGLAPQVHHQASGLLREAMMKATMQAAPPLMDRRRPSRNYALAQRYKAFKPGTMRDVVTDSEYDAQRDQRIYRVRLEQERVQTQKSVFGETLYQTINTYLDGTVEQTSFTSARETKEVTTLPVNAVPVRTKDVTDFGRLSTAVGELVKIVQNLPADPPPEQVESIYASYQRILEWRRRARQMMTQAEGEIDVLENLMKGAL